MHALGLPIIAAHTQTAPTPAAATSVSPLGLAKLPQAASTLTPQTASGIVPAPYAAQPTAPSIPLSIAQAAYAAGFRGQSLVTAIAIALAESSGNPNAVNSSDPNGGSFGLWQINGIHASEFGSLWSQVLNPTVNAQMAYAVSGGGTNFTPWSTFTSGAYAANLGVAQTAASQVSGGAVSAGTSGSDLLAGAAGNPATSCAAYQAWATSNAKLNFLGGHTLYPSNIKAIVSAGILGAGLATMTLGLVLSVALLAMDSKVARQARQLVSPITGGSSSRTSGGGARRPAPSPKPRSPRPTSPPPKPPPYAERTPYSFP